jgi:uncharacterized protein YcsI (UPF0317 family)
MEEKKFIAINEEETVAVYYYNKLHRRRMYRQGFPKPESVGMRLFAYKDKAKAQKVVDRTVEVHGAPYKVKEITVDFIKTCIKKATK